MTEENNRISDFERRRKLIKTLTLESDIFMSVALEDLGACEDVLRILLEKPDLQVKSVKTQYSIRNLKGHSVVLDVLAEDKPGRIYNIEMRKKNEKHDEKRIRYYSANVDAHFLGKGVSYDKLPEVYIIYISTYDIFELGKTVYDIQNVIEGTSRKVNNGLHIKYVNTKIDDGTDIAKLMKYFHDGKSEDQLFQRLVNRADCLKERKGVAKMCEIFEKEYRLGEERATIKGITALVQTLRELQLPDQLILTKVMEKFSLQEDAARAYLEK